MGHFCPLGSGSGSTDPIESGSNPDPNTQPWMEKYLSWSGHHHVHVEEGVRQLGLQTLDDGMAEG